MKSYALAMAVAMLAAAGYVFQNPGDVTVRVLLWERQMPQGVWEVLLFALGALLMWIVSLLALMEEVTPLRRKIAALEGAHRETKEEKDRLWGVLESLRPLSSGASSPSSGDFEKGSGLGGGRGEEDPAEPPSGDGDLPVEALPSETLGVYAHPKVTEEDPAELCLECEGAGGEDLPAETPPLEAVEIYAHPKVTEEDPAELCLECEGAEGGVSRAQGPSSDAWSEGDLSGGDDASAASRALGEVRKG